MPCDGVAVLRPVTLGCKVTAADVAQQEKVVVQLLAAAGVDVREVAVFEGRAIIRCAGGTVQVADGVLTLELSASEREAVEAALRRFEGFLVQRRVAQRLKTAGALRKVARAANGTLVFDVNL